LESGDAIHACGVPNNFKHWKIIHPIYEQRLGRRTIRIILHLEIIRTY
jgi:hypothetical protein